MEQTARFAIPLLHPGQQQKEAYHNEAIQQIEALLCATVEGPPIPAPPSSPPAGSCFLVAAGASGAWAGQEGALACMTDGGWCFIAPRDGMRVLDGVSGQAIVRRNGAWESGIARVQEVRVGRAKVVGSRQPSIAVPSGGAVSDGECRAAVASIITALQTHGLIA
jgi:hypothetical protein